MLDLKLNIGILCVVFLTGCVADENANVEHANVCIDLSPDGKTVVFSSADGDLYLFDISKNLASHLTDTDFIESCPSFSPDGRTVVFAATKNETSPCSIYVINLANLETTQLTDPAGQSDFHPRFSSDGKQIVFARAYRQRAYSLGGLIWDNWDVCSMADDGNDITRLTNENYYQLNRIVPKTDNSLIFSASTIPDGPPAGLYSLAPQGKPQLIVPVNAEKNSEVHAWASDPMISLDQKSIVYTSDRKKSFWYDVCVEKGDNNPKCLVGLESRYNCYPDFFPDGNRIIFLAGTKFNRGSRPIYSLWDVTLEGQTTEIASDDLFTNPGTWLSRQGTAQYVEPNPE